QSERACGPFLPFTEPAVWMAFPNSNSFSVIVVLPASGWEIMAKVRRLESTRVRDGIEIKRFLLLWFRIGSRCSNLQFRTRKTCCASGSFKTAAIFADQGAGHKSRMFFRI